MSSRRTFCSLALSAVATSLLPAMASGQAELLHVSAANLQYRRVPKDFCGLSYEMPQLYNPLFFSAKNKQLIKVFRELSPNGVLRLGGNLGDLARWQSEAGDFATEKQSVAIEHGKTYWEWKLTDMSVREHRDGAITPKALHSLREFLDATNWRLIYGLNSGSGTPERAADEAAWVTREIGDRLLSFQVGNESDFFGGNRFFREKGYAFANYLADYKAVVSAVRQRTPGAPFAGPDTASSMEWVQQFGMSAEKPIVLLSSHFYAMGPAKSPEMNAARLLGPNAHLDQQIAQSVKAVQDSGGVPFRMTEGNSCYGGGKPDVSDAFASALWGADYMLHLASAGCAGVNLHGGGDGIYTPIETLDAVSAKPRPLYYGMQFAQRFAGQDISALEVPGGQNATAYLGKGDHGLQFAVINKSAEPKRIVLQGGPPSKVFKSKWVLSAPAIDAKEGVSFATSPWKKATEYVVAPYTAELFAT